MRKQLIALALVPVLTLGIRQAGWAQAASLLNPSSAVRWPTVGPVVDGLSLSAKTDKLVYTGGEAIVLKIDLNNPTTSTQSRIITGRGFGGLFDMFDFDVTFADEGQVPLTGFGKKALKRNLNAEMDPFSIYGVSVAPGKADEYRVVISRLFDMSRGGSYRIIVRWHDPSVKQILPALVSNETAVRVDEPAREFYGSYGVAHH